jgi:hypothetical protein
MYCRNCGANVQDNAKFCTKCGAALNDISNDTVNTENMKAVEAVSVSDAGVEEEKEGTKKSPALKIITAVLAVLLFAAAFGAGTVGAVKTGNFKKSIKEFENMPESFESLGKFQSEYDELLADADNSASHFRLWEYDELVQKMSDLNSNIKELNEAVAVYREEYDAIVQEIETDGRYVMDEYDADYQSAKQELENSLEEFDEKSCKKNTETFSKVRDKIVTGNEKKAEEYIERAKDIQNIYSGYDVHPFEEYMISTLASEVESDKKDKDYIKLADTYSQLNNWAEKFSAAASSVEQISKYVQADVSSTDKVKLYINSYDYETYNFKLEDFIIYEKYNEVWEECHAVDISQIEGMLSMDIVADISGSMYDDFYDMQNAIEGFINITHSDTVLGLSTIGSIYERYQDFTTDKNEIINSVWNLECNGLTSLYQSLYSSVVYTASSEGARCVVAFTDGLNVPYGAGYDYDAQDVIDVSLYYQVPVYIVGIGSRVDSSELRNIAESTGGAYYANMSVYDLQQIYTDIYEAQGRMYQLSYDTSVPNNINRDIYVLYADDTRNLGIRFESEINAEALQTAYAAAGMNADDLTSYYTDSKYLSSDDLAKLGDNLEAVQTIINIYYAKNGYAFGDGENGQKQLSKMINLGVVTENGTLDGDTVTAILKSNPILWQNFSALYNYRYEIVYSTAYDIYQNNPGISYEDLRTMVNQHYGEENEIRFQQVISVAWKNIQAS